MTAERRKRDERGASAVEYGLLIAAVAATIVLVLYALSGPTVSMYDGACDDWRQQTQGQTC